MSSPDRHEKQTHKRGNGVRGWRIAFLVVCTVGACLAVDLVRLHVKVNTDLDYHSYCAISARVNCDTVAESKFSVQWGLPVAVWGLLAYLLMGVMVVWGLRSRLPSPSWPFGILFWASAAALLFSLRLAYLSHVVVDSICPVCVGTYLVNLLLLGIALAELRRVGASPWSALRVESRIVASSSRMAILGGLALTVIVALLLTVPHYWEVELSSGPGGLPVGRTADGHPWIGAQDPTVEIVEYSDYQCPHCLRGHQEMRDLIERRADEVRLIHRHYPLDNQCNPTMSKQLHPFACEYSRLAFCAGEQRKFWEANDFLFANGRRNDKVTARELAGGLDLDAGALESCVGGQVADAAVREDLADGVDRNVRGTPTFILGGRAYPGRIPPDALAAALSAGQR